jgi:hypothetical protein
LFVASFTRRINDKNSLVGWEVDGVKDISSNSRKKGQFIWFNFALLLADTVDACESSIPATFSNREERAIAKRPAPQYRRVNQMSGMSFT